MQIPITFETNLNIHLSKYAQCLFQFLQEDESLEKVIASVRQDLKIKIPPTKQLTNLDIITIRTKPLRSESKLIPVRPTVNVCFRSPTSLELDRGVEKVIRQFPFLQDWRRGLANFVLGDRFTVSNESSKIKLTVRNRKYPYIGRYTDVYHSEGVKIVLTSKVTKHELNEWVKEHWSLIDSHLRQLSGYSQKSSRKDNFERDRLVTYLRLFQKLHWGKINDILIGIGDKSYGEDTLMQAVKDFPYKSMTDF